ncbi:MAG: nucleotide exchange factor GrpE [Gemmataceae bacterium]
MTRSPEAIESLFGDFRQWLEEAHAETATPQSAPVVPGGASLASLVGAFVALRHDVNLSTKATRTLTEQTKILITTPPAPPRPDASEMLVRTLMDCYDALHRAHQAVQLMEWPIPDQDLAPIPAAIPAEEPTRSWWPWSRKVTVATVAAAVVPTEIDTHQRKKFEAQCASVADGYTLSLRRLNQLFHQFEIEPIDPLGKPFDPDTMEAIELVTDPSLPPGHVAQVMRRGYRSTERLLRTAQVRVVRMNENE